MALRIAVLISGTGSNLRAILEAIEHGTCAARVCSVISDKRNAPGLELARARKIPTAVVTLKSQPNRPAWDRALADAVTDSEVDLVVLAGFMKIVGRAMIERFPNRIVNVHPSLLPLFPGVDGPAQAVAAGVRISGCTVHLVDQGIDSGAILAQAAVPVLPDDDGESLHRRIQRAEHQLLPAVIDAIATGRLPLGGPRPNASGSEEGSDEGVLFSPHALLFPGPCGRATTT